ncbi:MAG: NADH-quinone oxidoreductase subunit NuoH [Planctomycetota bacterium]
MFEQSTVIRAIHSTFEWLLGLVGVDIEIIPESIRVVLYGLVAAGGLMSGIALSVMLYVWMERRIAGRIQARCGPNRVGPFGLLQTLADTFKLLRKEDIIPTGANKFLFAFAPMIVLAGVVAAFAAVPFSYDTETGEGIMVADIDLGIFLITSIIATEVIGVIMAGWASNNKWSLYGAMREAAQVVSYEIPLGLSVLVPVMIVGSLSLADATADQLGGNWLLWRSPFMPVVFFIFYVAGLAGCKRAPFDLPEAESELVAGFHTEYSGLRFSFFFMEEYASMTLISAIGAIFFFGGGDLFGLQGDSAILMFLILIVKILISISVMIWIRWTLPRLRVDQVMTLGYKVLTPLAFFMLLGATIWDLTDANERILGFLRRP